MAERERGRQRSTGDTANTAGRYARPPPTTAPHSAEDVADAIGTRRYRQSSARRSVSESRIVTPDEMREMDAAIQRAEGPDAGQHPAAASPWYVAPTLAPEMDPNTYGGGWPQYYGYYGYEAPTMSGPAEWPTYYQSIAEASLYEPLTASAAAAAAAAASTAAFYGANSPEALAAAQIASDTANAGMLLMPPAPITASNRAAAAPSAGATTTAMVVEPTQPGSGDAAPPAPSGTTDQLSPLGWNTAVLDRAQPYHTATVQSQNIPGIYRAGSTVNRGTTSFAMRASALNNSIRRRRTVKHVELTDGNLIVDCMVPNKLLERCEIRTGDEFTRLRYSAVTCDPDDFSRASFTLRPALYNRTTELFIVITMYNEDETLFARTMSGIMRNIQHLCSRNRSSTWGEHGWQKVVVCVVADGRKHVNQRVLNVLAAMGVYQDGIAKNQVNGREVKAHLFEYTTQLSVTSNMKIIGTEKGVIPCQMMFCLKEKNAKKINSHRWFFNAFAPALNPNVCVLVDVGTRPADSSIYHLWKAFDVDPLVGGACGEVGVMKGLAWWHLLNPLVASQHFEYKMSNILDKPLESTLGYIMVLPGAFSAYRYAAVKDDVHGRGPLASYFKGEAGYQPPLQPGQKATSGRSAGIFEANMYLAEDRVLCFEVVAKRNERWLLRYVRSAYGETDVPQSLAEFIAQRRRWLNGSFFAAVYALVHWYRIWQSNHSILRNLVFFLQFIYTAYNIIFTWFGMANFYLTFHFLSRTMASPTVDPIPGNYGRLLANILDYIYIVLMVSMFVCALGNRPRGSKLMYILAMTMFSLFMAYMMGVSVFLAIRGVRKAMAQLTKENNVSVVSILFGNAYIRDLILAVGSTYGVYLLVSLLYLQPWHMITSFLQYTLLIPTYINVLNVYAFCNTHDVSWGTKSDGPEKLDLGVAVPMPTKGGSQTVQLVLPGVGTDLNTAYEEVLSVLRTPVAAEPSHRDAKTRQEDYYRMIRTWLVLFWIMSNAVLALVIANTQLNSLLTPRDTEELDSENPARGMYLANWYFSVILWSVAALVLFRFIGSIIYLVRYTFGRGR